MSSIERWSGREVRALRAALRMSLRRFSEHLDINFRLISKWEGGQTSPGPDNQSVLDAALGLLTEEQRARFTMALSTESRLAEPKTPCQLLRDVPDFTGRDEETRRLVKMLSTSATGGVRVVAIHGPAGVGKTVLATHVAHRVRAKFPDGQLYVNLRGSQAQKIDVGDVIAGFLHDLDRGGVVSGSIEEQARAFRTALSEKRILLVLDNADDESQVLPLLPGDAGCAVLVTSRRRLSQVDGAGHLSLQLMAPEQGVSLLAAIVGPSRVEAEPDAAAEIVQLCGQLPLALRIAGARLSSRPGALGGFAERLRDEQARLNLLQDGDRAVRASFLISYDGCEPAVRRAFRLLGMLEGSDFPAWVLAILAEVSVSEAESLLEELVDAELLEIAAEGPLERHYRFHDLLYLFAREQLDAEENTTFRRLAAHRLLTEYITMCALVLCRDERGRILESAPATLLDIHDTIRNAPHVWLRSEWSALVSAVTIAHNNELWEEAWLLAEQLGSLSHWHSGWGDWERTMERNLEAARAGRDRPREARLRCSLGVLRREQGRFTESIVQLRYSADLFDQMGDSFHQAVIHRALADTFRYTGQLAEGIKHFTIALRMFESADDDQMVAGTLSGMGDIYRGLSRWDQSILCLNRSVELHAKASNHREVARAKVLTGIVCRDRSHYGSAEELFYEALRTVCDLGDRRWEANALRHLGIVFRNTGRFVPAVVYLRRALAVYESLADSRNIAVTHRNLGDAHRYVSDFEQALELLYEALRNFRRLPDPRWEARTRASLGDLERARGNYAGAIEHLEAALRVFTRIQDRPGQGRTHRSYGILHREQGRFDESMRSFELSRSIFRDLGDQVWAARALAGYSETRRAAALTDWLEFLHDAEAECRSAGAKSPQEIDNWLFEW